MVVRKQLALLGPKKQMHVEVASALGRSGQTLLGSPKRLARAGSGTKMDVEKMRDCY